MQGVEHIARGAGLNEVLLALIVAPIATELPEAANAILWLRRGKDTLAIGNITGAMVFQAAIATLVALVFAPAAWHIDARTRLLAFLSAGIAFLAVAAIFGPMWRRGTARRHGRCSSAALLYLGYLALVVPRHRGGPARLG